MAIQINLYFCNSAPEMASTNDNNNLQIYG
jgi:hypothetical protein